MAQAAPEETLRRFADAFAAGDIEKLVELTTPDCVIVALRSQIEGEFRGHEGVRRWAEGYFETAPDATLTTERVVPIGADRVVVLGRQRGSARTAGAPFDEPLAGIARFERGLIAEWRSYETHAQALAAAGLDQ